MTSALFALLALLPHALAGVPEDVRTAADTDLPMVLREEAFGRLAAATSTTAVVTALNDKATSSAERWVLVRSLGANPTPEARTELLRLLDDKVALTRVAALGGMGDTGDIALSGRVAAGLADPAILVRSAAAEALGRLKDPAALAGLDRALADPTNFYRGASLWVRRQYVDAMANIGGDGAVPYLGKALDDKDPEVVRAAVTGLEKVAGFTYREGRTEAEQIEAWRRWARR